MKRSKPLQEFSSSGVAVVTTSGFSVAVDRGQTSQNATNFIDVLLSHWPLLCTSDNCLCSFVCFFVCLFFHLKWQKLQVTTCPHSNGPESPFGKSLQLNLYWVLWQTRSVICQQSVQAAVTRRHSLIRTAPFDQMIIFEVISSQSDQFTLLLNGTEPTWAHQIIVHIGTIFFSATHNRRIHS